MPKFEFDETVKLAVDRVAGTRNDRCTVHASSKTAAMKGLYWLVETMAAELGMSWQEIVCRLAVILDGKEKERNAETDG